MKRFALAACTLALFCGAPSVFAQASGAMAQDSMAKDSMSHDSMSKDSGSKMKHHDKMKKDTSGAAMKSDDQNGMSK